MEVKLIVVGGKASSREISLKLPTTIGRSREADLTVAHPMVSRRHCELFETSGLLMVRDLDSLNGTFVGEQRVGEAPLPPDASFTVGPLTFAVQYSYSGDLSSLPAIVPAAESPRQREAAAADRKATPAQQRTPKTEPVTPHVAAQPADNGELEDLELAEPLEADADFELEEQPASAKAKPPADDAVDDLEEFALSPDEDDDVIQPGKKPAASKPKPAPVKEESGSDPEEDAFNDFLKGLQ